MRALPSSRCQAVVEDVLWLSECGESMEHIAHRLGYSCSDNLAATLARWGEESLARRVRYYASGRVSA